MDDEFWVGQLHQMAGFNNLFQIAVEQLGLKSIVRVGLVAQATNVVRHMIRAAKQSNNLVHGMDPQTIERPILRQARLSTIYRAIVIEMVFNLDELPQFAALNDFLRGQKAGVKAAVLVRSDRQPFAFRQRE